MSFLSELYNKYRTLPISVVENNLRVDNNLEIDLLNKTSQLAKSAITSPLSVAELFSVLKQYDDFRELPNWQQIKVFGTVDGKPDLQSTILKEYQNGFAIEYGNLGLEGFNKNFKNPIEIVSALNLQNGWKNIDGFSIGTDHVWELSIEPYLEPAEGITEDIVVTPKFPIVKIGDRTFDYNQWFPVLNYDLSIGNIEPLNIDLYDMKLEVPNGFTHSYNLSLTMLDDRYGSIRRYWTQYINSIYDPYEKSVAPYFLSAFKITLYALRPDYGINHRFGFIAVPKSINLSLKGDESPSTLTIPVEFSIVGISEGRHLNTSGNYNWKNDEIIPYVKLLD